MENLKMETNRLFITQFEKSMAKSVHTNSLDMNNRRFVPDEVFETEEEAYNTINFLMKCYEGTTGPFVYPILLRNNENIGYVQAVPLDNGEWEVGYHIAENYVRNGYATEAIIAFLPIIMKRLNISVIWGICRGDNIASRRVLEKCSFVLKQKSVTNYKGEQHEVCKYLYTAV